MSHRTEQIAEVIQHKLNDFLVKEAEPPKDTLITITKVEVVKDLSHAFISLSVLPINKTGTAVNFINRSLHQATQHLKKHTILRRIPKLVLKIDDSALKSRRIERGLES